MTINEFFNYILTPFLGSNDGFILNVDTLYITMFDNINADNWTALLTPQIFCSALLYIGLFVGLWSILIVFPYRLIKRLIGYRSKKSSER